MDYSKRVAFTVSPFFGFDWYVVGYCISHFDERWGLHVYDNMGMDNYNSVLLVAGLQFSAVAKGKIHYLHLSLMSLSFSQVITPLREFCKLDHLVLDIDYDIDRDDEVALQQLIAPGSGPRRLDFTLLDFSIIDLHSNILLAIFFQPSSLQELRLKYESKVQIDCHEPLPHVNTNLKELTISGNLLHPLAALIVNITSLTYLEISDLYKNVLPVLTNIVQSHLTLEVLRIRQIRYYTHEYQTNLLQLIGAAGNSQQLKKLRLSKYYYDKLPPHIHEQYKHLLEPYSYLL